MKSNKQLKYSNYVVFNHFHGIVVNNSGLNKDLNKIFFSLKKREVNLDKSEIERFMKLNINESEEKFKALVEATDNEFKDITKNFGKFILKYKITDYVYIVDGGYGEIYESFDHKDKRTFSEL